MLLLLLGSCNLLTPLHVRALNRTQVVVKHDISLATVRTGQHL